MAGDPAGDPNLAAYWKRSMNKGGSPFANDPVSTSMEEIRQRLWGDLKIYPNPTGGVIVVNVSEETDGIMKLRFTSATGTTVMVRDIEGTTVMDLSEEGFAPGVYTVTAEYGGVSYRTKVVYMPERY
ncbi:T9SS type A sorting domain-containing protein [bacterium]|nr:T9SS type A sorting domain-containing protein [bacterium]